jgi:hypothetical protein
VNRNINILLNEFEAYSALLTFVFYSITQSHLTARCIMCLSFRSTSLVGWQTPLINWSLNPVICFSPFVISVCVIFELSVMRDKFMLLRRISTINHRY